jgi:hypothetical protein
MKTISRKKVSECKLYTIKAGHDEFLSVVVTPYWGGYYKPTPRIYTGGCSPMLEVSRKNFAEVIRAHRKQERGDA